MHIKVHFYCECNILIVFKFNLKIDNITLRQFIYEGDTFKHIPAHVDRFVNSIFLSSKHQYYPRNTVHAVFNASHVNKIIKRDIRQFMLTNLQNQKYRFKELIFPLTNLQRSLYITITCLQIVLFLAQPQVQASFFDYRITLIIFLLSVNIVIITLILSLTLILEFVLKLILNLQCKLHYSSKCSHQVALI